MVYPGYGSTTLWSRWRAGGSGGGRGRSDFFSHLLLPRLEPCLLLLSLVRRFLFSGCSRGEPIFYWNLHSEGEGSPPVVAGFLRERNSLVTQNKLLAETKEFGCETRFPLSRDSSANLHWISPV